MSFINLMADDIWSETDIVARTEAMVREVLSDQEQTILIRKVMGASLGFWQLSADEIAMQTNFTEACKNAHDAGISARLDNDLLQRTIAYEQTLITDESDPENEELPDPTGVDSDVYALFLQRREYRNNL